MTPVASSLGSLARIGMTERRQPPIPPHCAWDGSCCDAAVGASQVGRISYVARPSIRQYKGEATYFRVRDSDVRLWTYRHPDPEAAAIAGHVAAAAGHPGVHISVDGIPEAQP